MYTRIFKVTSTIADLEDSDSIESHHISEAVQYRMMDRGCFRGKKLTDVIQKYYDNCMIVFDSSTLILLAKIDMLELFVNDLSGKILIPEKVKRESCDVSAIEVPFILKLIEKKKIKVSHVKGKKEIRKLMDDFHLDSGEAEAIALALQKGYKIIATDDRNAIKACRLLNLDFITAISVLIRAYEKKVIGKEEALAKLERLVSEGRYSKKIINDARARIKGGN